MRGFMTARGLPDNPRSSRHILKDFVQGKLLYCVAPPNVDKKQFQSHSIEPKKGQDKPTVAPTPFQLRVTRVCPSDDLPLETLQNIFFFCVANRWFPFADELQQRPVGGQELLYWIQFGSSQQRSRFDAWIGSHWRGWIQLPGVNEHSEWWGEAVEEAQQEEQAWEAAQGLRPLGSVIGFFL